MGQLGPLLRVSQGINQGTGQDYWGAHVVIDSIQFLVVVGLRTSAFCCCCFMVVIACWPEAALSSQRPPVLPCQVRFLNMATCFLRASKGETPARQALGFYIASSYNYVHVITYTPAPLLCSVVQKQISLTLKGKDHTTLGGGSHRNHLKTVSATVDLEIM